MIRTKDMSLREYLSTMSFQPKQAAALERLFKLAEGWEREIEIWKEIELVSPEVWKSHLRACAKELTEALDS